MIINVIRERLFSKEYKTVFVSTFVFGLIAHAYVFLNSNFSHDSLFYLNYTESNIIKLQIGRFIRPIYQNLRGLWELPWINGLLSLLFLSISAYLIMDVIGLKNRKYVITSCGILTTCSSMALLNASYLHDSDSYCLALLFACVGVWLSKNVKNGHIFAILFNILSLGIYQSYIQVSIFIYIVLFIFDILKNRDLKDIFVELIKDALTIACSMIVYYFLYKLLLIIFSVNSASPYLNVSRSTDFQNFSILTRLNCVFISEIDWLLYPFANSRTLVVIINIILILVSIVAVVLILLKQKLSIIKLCVLIFTIVVTPFAINIITFTSADFHALSLYNLFLCYVFVLLLLQESEREWNLNVKKLSSLSLILLSIMIVDNCLYSNKIYLQKDLISKNTLSTMTRVIDRFEQVDGYKVGKTPVALIGSLGSSELSYVREGFITDGTGLGSNFSTSYRHAYVSYFENYLGYPLNLLSEEQSDLLEETPEVKQMPSFPYDGCCEIINGVLVVKLSD